MAFKRLCYYDVEPGISAGTPPLDANKRMVYEFILRFRELAARKGKALPPLPNLSPQEKVNGVIVWFQSYVQSQGGFVVAPGEVKPGREAGGADSTMDFLNRGLFELDPEEYQALESYANWLNNNCRGILVQGQESRYFPA
jgi:hypothetical protein